MRTRLPWLPLLALCAWAMDPLYAASAVPQPTPAASVPNAFGSIALPLGPNRYSARWQRVASAGGSDELAAITLPARTLDRAGQARFVNAALNRRIAYRADKGDHWSTANETLARAGGDCEDYAIAKLHALRALGVPASDLFLILGRDTAVRQAHAVLLIRVGHRFWVMDNRSARLIPDNQFRDFSPIISFRADGKSWLHGYARKPLRMAQNGRPTAG